MLAATGGVVACGGQRKLWERGWADEQREATPLNIAGLRQRAPKIAEVRRKIRVSERHGGRQIQGSAVREEGMAGKLGRTGEETQQPRT